MSAAAAAASGAVASGDAAQRHLKDFLLDLRHNQARYDFTQGRAADAALVRVQVEGKPPVP